MKFFCDNCLSPKFVEMLRLFKVDIEHLQERFPENFEDVNWIPIVAAEGRIILTSDSEMKRRKTEAAVLRDNNAIAFFFMKGFANHRIWRQAELLCKYWPAILETAETAKAKDMFDLKERGKIVQARR